MISERDPNRNEFGIEIFADEIGKQPCPNTHENWLYVGALFIPTSTKLHLLQQLNNFRCLNDKNKTWATSQNECPIKCKYHVQNDTEIHYAYLNKSNSRPQIAKKWLEFTMKRALSQNLLYFSILGINLSNMDLDLFGDSNQKDVTYNVYTRFFRTLIKGGVKHFFWDKPNIVIQKVYHDRGQQETHPYFQHQPLEKLQIELSGINIMDKKIQFLDSDHKKSQSQNSQFIQLIDLLLGCVFINFHARSKNKEKIRLGLQFQGDLKKILDKQHPFGKKCSISFFPRSKIDYWQNLSQLDIHGNTLESSSSNNFYYSREILLKNSMQKSLF